MRFIFSTFLVCFLISLQNITAQELNYKPAFSTYWQQHVDYTMDIDMNVENYQYAGKQTLVYTNNSPDILYKVFYHLYFNAFQPDSEMDSRLKSVADPDDRMTNVKGNKYESKIAELKPADYGFIKVNKLTQNGNDVNYQIEGTILEVTLNQPVHSGEKVVFEMEFLGQVPPMIRRSGKFNKDGVELSMAQWYPKMAEYDVEGWNADPYLTREFYGVWGNFDVTIHIDKKYILGGTGYLINPQEVGYGYENTDIPINIPKGEKLTWHFNAPNVHDFSWAADKEYLHDVVPVKEGVNMHFLYKNDPKTKKLWKEVQPYAIKTMQFYNENIGEYPYKQYSIIEAGDGGMEYGMCTFLNKGNSLRGLAGLVAHEMAHAWFQFALATNEVKHAWMDEGFTSFIQNLAYEELFPGNNEFIFRESYEGYYYLVSTGEEEPLTTHADRFKTNMSYGISAYSKGSVFMSQLSYVIGWDNLRKTIKEYFSQWSGKHPNPNDFIRIAEKVSHLQLDWYLNEFAQTTHTIDYAIKSVKGNEIVLERIGMMPMPVDLDVVYEDGSKEQFYIPLSLMRGEKPTTAKILKDWGWGFPTYTFKTEKKIKEITIDTSLLMADINRANNHFAK